MRTAFREWRIRWDGGPVLQSTYRSNIWSEAELTADQEPEDSVDNNRLGGGGDPLHGVHACLPWCNSFFLTSPSLLMVPLKLFVIGAVDLQGKVVEHTDGVVRAKKIRILALRLIDSVNHSRWSPGCAHTDYHAVGGVYTDFLVLRRACGYPRGNYTPDHAYGCNGYAKVLHNERPYNIEHKIELTLNVKQIERALLERYEVPRLPDKEGPWEAPWGGGPALKKSGD